MGEVEDDVGLLPVEANDLAAGFPQRVRRGAADAARRAGDEGFFQLVRPGMAKPAALRSRISSSSCALVSSTSGGRQVRHCGSLPKCATALFSAGIIGCF